MMELFETAGGKAVSRQLPVPSLRQAGLLAAAGVGWPQKAPSAGPAVATRAKL